MSNGQKVVTNAGTTGFVTHVCNMGLTVLVHSATGRFLGEFHHSKVFAV